MTDPPPVYDYDAYAASLRPAVPTAKPRYSAAGIVAAAVCGVIGGTALLGFACGVVTLAASTVLPENPMTGLGLVTSVLLVASSAVVAAVVLPGAAPPGMRAHAYGISSAIFGVIALLACGVLTVL